MRVRGKSVRKYVLKLMILTKKRNITVKIMYCIYVPYRRPSFAGFYTIYIVLWLPQAMN